MEADFMNQIFEAFEGINNPESCLNTIQTKFWADKPECWFAQAEARFNIAGITQDAIKYGYVVSVLDTGIVDKVEDIITNPPERNKYENLKTELIRRLSTSKKQQDRQLLSKVQLGDRKPSAFLRKLRSLASSDLGDESNLRELWMRRLPTEVQQILIAHKYEPLEKVADIADEIVDFLAYSSRADEHAASTRSNQPPDLSKLIKQVEQLTLKVDSLLNDRRRGRSESRAVSRSRSASESCGKPRLCWYHRKFKTRAIKCISPCEWKPKGQKNLTCKSDCKQSI